MLTVVLYVYSEFLRKRDIESLEGLDAWSLEKAKGYCHQNDPSLDSVYSERLS